jgi:mannose-6-phosphate isomerase-like protein (cupin superfamily)
MNRPAFPFLLMAILGLGPSVFGGEPPRKAPAAKVIRLDTGGKDYLPVLSGPPETATMRSGLVVLAPGKAVGKHSTGRHEEILVVLEGAGEMQITGEASLPVVAGTAVYCPPRREHDVLNTGKTELRYVYVVARAQP